MSTNDELAEKFIRKCEAEVCAQIDGGLSEILSGLLDEAYERGRRDGLEEAAKVAEETFPKGSAHTYASENADTYIAQENTCIYVSRRIRARIKKGEGDE